MALTEQELFERFGRKFPAGHVLFEEGEKGEDTFIILSGSVRIVKRMEQGDRTLAVIHADECVGEMSTFLKEPRTATGIVEEDTEVLIVNNDTFESMVSENSGIAFRIIKKLAERLKNTTRQLEIMMFKDANSKVIYSIVNAAENGEVLPEGILIKTSPEDMVPLTGVRVSKIKEILHLLVSSRLVLSHEKGFVLTDKNKLYKFLEFLTLKEELGEFSTEALKTIISDIRQQTKNI